LIDLARLTRDVDGRILAKLDYLNPGSSKKDRIARQIIEDAEAEGNLRPGQTVVELTSGNTGTGLAIVCAVKGYPFVAVMSKGNSAERARMMAALGAEVVLVDQAAGGKDGHVTGDDLARVEREAQRIVDERGAFRADQFRLASARRAHELHTGPEIIAQCGGVLHAFCDFAGTGGTFAGCAAALKRHDPAIRCYLIEPQGAAVLDGNPLTNPHHRIQGGGYSLPDLPLIDRAHVDGYMQVSDDDAIAMTRRLAAEEGIFAGYSSGANVAAAMALLAGAHRGQTIAVMICDSGLKYMTTDLWP
jgi:cysteine synthase A